MSASSFNTKECVSYPTFVLNPRTLADRMVMVAVSIPLYLTSGWEVWDGWGWGQTGKEALLASGR